jgi:hypothetical protein
LAIHIISFAITTFIHGDSLDGIGIGVRKVTGILQIGISQSTIHVTKRRFGGGSEVDMKTSFGIDIIVGWKPIGLLQVL